MYKRRRNRLNESIDDIFENDFILEEDEAEAGESGEVEVDEEAAQEALMALASAFNMEVTPSGEEASEEEASDDDVADDDSEEEAPDDESSEDMTDLELDTNETYVMDNAVVEMDDGENEGEVFLEIDENMLRNEIGKMRAMREGDAAAMDSHFGGGKKGKEPFVDGEDLNKLDHVSSIKESARKVVRYNRQLEKQINEHKKALRAMKGQLQEMNLFNAKLLYANKLMQNKDLSLKQQKHIVESLDNAKTLGEAKVLFEGLTKSLNKGSSRTGALTEGTSRRVLGTSSRSTRSAQPANNRVEVDRWALLAGIKG